MQKFIWLSAKMPPRKRKNEETRDGTVSTQHEKTKLSKQDANVEPKNFIFEMSKGEFVSVFSIPTLPDSTDYLHDDFGKFYPRILYKKIGIQWGMKTKYWMIDLDKKSSGEGEGYNYIISSGTPGNNGKEEERYELNIRRTDETFLSVVNKPFQERLKHKNIPLTNDMKMIDILMKDVQTTPHVRIPAFQTLEWHINEEAEEKEKYDKKNRSTKNAENNQPTKIVAKNLTNKYDFSKFVATYAYNGDTYFYDDGIWYFGHNKNDITKSEQKQYAGKHTKIVKKSTTMNAYAKKNHDIYFSADEDIQCEQSFHELKLGKQKLHLLVYSLCHNDPLGETNVLYDDKKNEILRLEPDDISCGETYVDAIKWKSLAMEKKFATIASTIEPFLKQGGISSQEDYEYDLEKEELI